MIFITGGTGLLGMRIVYDLIVAGHEVKLLRRTTSDLDLFQKVLSFYHAGELGALLEKITWVEGSVLEIDLLEEELVDCSHCIHGAAMVSFHQKDHDSMHTINVEGTANMVNACLKTDTRLVHISSVAAIGRTSSQESITEDSSWKDSPHNSTYAVSKYHSELEVWRGIEEGLSAVMVNPSIILGAGTEKRSSGTIFGTVKKGLKFYTDGGAAVVDVRDVSSVVVELLFDEVSAERYILCETCLPYRDLFNQIANKLGLKEPSVYAPTWMLSIGWRLAYVKDLVLGTRSPITRETAMSAQSTYSYNSSKVKKKLGKSFYTLEDTLTYFSPFYLQKN